MGIHIDAASIEGRAIPNVRPSIRAQFITRRTYLRPLDEDGTIFETWDEAEDRVIGHQRWLWETALGRSLNVREEAELFELRSLIRQALVSVSGRVKWMGGTDLVKERAAGAFNCSFTTVNTPADLVDVFWLLLQGAGVGFLPITGLLSGLPSTITEVVTIPSTRTGKGGAEDSVSIIDREQSTWTIRFGDSAKAWAKALGMLTGEKPRVKTLVLDFSELRPGGKRLRGYGWLSSGWEPLQKGMLGIVKVMQRKGEALLDDMDIGDIVNWLGTVLSSRRSAQIWLRRVWEATWDEILKVYGAFIDAKTDRWEKGEGQREQSNNSLVFMRKPERDVIVKLLLRILDTGEPGFVNGAAAKARAPEMEGLNPCAEILLASKGVCNLMQVVWHRFNGDLEGLKRAQYIAGRANYRQACVSMRDGVLQLGWNDTQKLLRLCGVSPTGYVAWEGMNNPQMLEAVRDAAIDGANSMADDLGLQRPRRITQVQPAGTSSKALGLDGDEVHEGAHLAMSRWIFNNVNFSVFDPMVGALAKAGYRVQPNPNDPNGVLVTFPVEYPASPLFMKVKKVIDGKEQELEINTESAISQLERYRILMNHYVQHNCFSRSTKFVTKEKGLVPFSEFNDGDKIHVLGQGGKWRPATVKNFGKQEIVEVTFRRGVTKMVIETTAEHRWPVTNGNASYRGAEPKIVTTAELDGYKGDMVNNYVSDIPALMLEGIAHGIVYGDGTLTKGGSCQVFLCDGGGTSADKRSLARYFEALGYRSIEHADKGQVRIHGLPSHWKALPDNLDPEYLRGFFAGWFATDGNVGASPMLARKDREALVWARQVAPIAGLSTSTVIGRRESIGFGGELSTYYVLGLIGLTTNDAFYLLSEKSKHFTQSKHWKVESVRNTGRFEEAWCVEEPEFHLFTLDGDLLTSNCSITVSFDRDEIEEMADWFMEHWDEYVGVSFLKRNDPTRTAEELGFRYLPQECVSREIFETYARTLLPVDLSQDISMDVLEVGGCGVGGGACPVR